MAKNLALTLVTMLALLLGLEATLRVTHAFGARISPSRPDPVLGWRFVPDREFVSLDENPRPVRWRTNGYGWKDDDWSPRKAPGVFRVAVLGDSYAESMQVEPEKNAIALAEELLAARGHRTEWLNFGRSGAGQAEQHWLAVNEVPRFAPDAVVLFFFPVNDIDDVAPATSADAYRPFYTVASDGTLALDTSFTQTRGYRLKRLVSPLKNHSALVSLVTERYSTWTRMARLRQAPAAAGGFPGYLSLATGAPEPKYAANYRLAKELLRRTALHLRRSGVPVFLAVLDVPAYQPTVLARLRARRGDYDPHFFARDLADLAGETGMTLIDMQQPFETAFATRGPLHWTAWPDEVQWTYGHHTGHWNYAGQEVAAAELAAWLGRHLRTVAAPH